MKKNRKLIWLSMLVILYLGAMLGSKVIKADGPSYQVIFVNQPKTFCILTSGEIDINKHTLKLEYYSLESRKVQPHTVYVAEAVNEFTDLKIIGSFQINLNTQEDFGKATYLNASLTKEKRYIIWVSKDPIKNLSSNEKKSILERAEAVLAEQYRLVYIGAYKSVDDMVDEAGKNYEE